MLETVRFNPPVKIVREVYDKLKIYDIMARNYEAFSSLFLRGAMTEDDKNQLNDFKNLIMNQRYKMESFQKGTEIVRYAIEIHNNLEIYRNFLKRFEKKYNDAGFSLYDEVPEAEIDAQLTNPIDMEYSHY